MRFLNVVALLLVLAGIGFSVSTVSGCMNISAPGVYQLNQSISGANISYTYGMSCIEVFSPNVVLDCRGFNVTNDGTSDAEGIYIDELDAGYLSNITIEHCNVSSYGWGISNAFSLSTATGINIINNSVTNNGDGIFITNDRNGFLNGNNAYNNSDEGLYLREPYNDIVANNTLTDNSGYDFFQDVWTGSDCVNTIQNNTGSGDLPILWANSNVVEANTVFSEVFLCNANGAKFTNVTIQSSDSVTNNGFYMALTQNANITDVNSSDDYSGFSLSSSSGNTFVNDTANNDYGSGFSLQSSSNNNLTLNTADNDNNEFGFYLSYSYNDILANNTADDNNGGIRLVQSNGNTIANNTLLENTGLDFWVDIQSGSDCANIVQNNTGSGYEPIIWANSTITVSGANLSEVLLCNATRANFTDDIIHGSDSFRNNGFYMYLTKNATISNDDSYGNTNGFAVEYSSNNLLANDTASNDEGGMGAYSGSGNVFINDSMYYDVEAFGISSSPNNSLINDSIHDNLNDGVDIYYSDNNTFINDNISNNPRGGIYIQDSNATTFTNMYLSNDCFYSYCLGEFQIGTYGTPTTVYLRNFTIDDREGDLQGYTSLDINDSVEPYTDYMVRWAAEPSGLPGGQSSFAQKFVNITTVEGPVSIDSIAWTWQGSELASHNDSTFSLWKYNNSGWTDQNAALDTVADTLSITGLDPGSVYGILENATSNCPVISVPGTTYTMASDLSGAPNSVLGMDACVVIDAPDVVFDCQGHSITGGTGGTTAGIFVNSTATGAVIQGCPSISDYSYGVYASMPVGLNITNATASNFSQEGFSIKGSGAVISDDVAWGSPSGGGFEASGGSAITFENDSAFNVSEGFRSETDGVQVINDTVDNATGFGIIMEADSQNATDNTVSDSGYGFDISLCHDANISGNRVYGGTYGYGIYSTNSSSFGDDTATNCASFCFDMSDSYYDNLTMDNATGGYRGFNIGDSASDVFLSDVAADSTDSGFLLSSVTGSNFTGVTAYGNGYDGIRALSDTGDVYRDISSTGNTNSGFDESTTTTPAAVLDHSVFSGNGNWEIIQGSSNSVEFVMNNSLLGDNLNLSITDEVGSGGGGYDLSETGDPANSSFWPSNMTPFSTGFLDVLYTGDLGINYTTFIWNASAASGIDESSLQLYTWDGANWTLTPNQALYASNHSLLVLGIDAPAYQDRVYGLFYQNTTPISAPPSEPSTQKKPSLSLGFSSSCSSNNITVGSGSPLEGATVVVDGDIIGTSDSDGKITFPGCGQTVTIDARADGYIPTGGIQETEISCGQCQAPQCTSDSQCPDADTCMNQTCAPVSCSCGYAASHTCQNYECCADKDCPTGQVCTSHSCKPKQQQCTPPGCCTADTQCGDTQNCLSATGAPASATAPGKCNDITGCGSIANHVLTPYQCGPAPGCPTCEQGSVCTNNICVPHDLKGPQNGFVGDNADVQATEGDTSCANCQLQITDPTGKNLTGSTDSKGGFVLPLTLQGNYTIALIKDGVTVKTLMIESLPKAPPEEQNPPTATGSPMVWSILGLILLVIVVIVLIVYYMSRKGKKK